MNRQSGLAAWKAAHTLVGKSFSFLARRQELALLKSSIQGVKNGKS
jgi:hypothetical protein